MSLAKAQPHILEPDQRRVLFCPIQDLESIFAHATEDSFLKALHVSADEEYSGWPLREIHRESSRELNLPRKKFPFKLDDVLPWWRQLQNTLDVHIQDSNSEDI
jgi:hypothetical protein